MKDIYMPTVPLVSVNMITYNHEPYIAQAIEGVVNQRANFTFELLIGEDCSTDNTRQIVLDYQKRYPNIIRVISSDINLGATSNLYQLMLECSGKYISFCEGDDYWIDPYKLQKQFDFMEAHQKCGLVHTDYDIFHEESGVFEKSIHKKLKSKLSGKCFERYWNMVGYKLAIKTVTVMWRSDYKVECCKLLQAGIENNWKLGDFQLFALISKNSEVGYLSESTSVYRARKSGSATSSDNNDLKKTIEFTESILSSRRFLIEYLDLDSIRFKPSLIKDCEKIMFLSYRNENWVKFRQYHRELLDLRKDNLFGKLLDAAVRSNSPAFRKLVNVFVFLYSFATCLVNHCLQPSMLLSKIYRKGKSHFA